MHFFFIIVLAVCLEGIVDNKYTFSFIDFFLVSTFLMVILSICVRNINKAVYFAISVINCFLDLIFIIYYISYLFDNIVTVLYFLLPCITLRLTLLFLSHDFKIHNKHAGSDDFINTNGLKNIVWKILNKSKKCSMVN